MGLEAFQRNDRVKIDGRPGIYIVVEEINGQVAVVPLRDGPPERVHRSIVQKAPKPNMGAHGG